MLAIGGDRDPHSGYLHPIAPALFPELLVNGEWLLDDGTDFDIPTDGFNDIIRDYHSTALLLPTGQVFVTGGESRRRQPSSIDANGDFVFGAYLDRPADYQIYNPPYLRKGYWRPVLDPTLPMSDPSTPALELTPGQTLEIDFEGSETALDYVESAVLVRAGSVTHHADTNQRVVELTTRVSLPAPGSSVFRAFVHLDAGTYARLTKGYHMMFLMTNRGVPCEHAVWVKVKA